MNIDDCKVHNILTGPQLVDLEADAERAHAALLRGLRQVLG